METAASFERKFVVQNKLGLHARPAALLVRTANKFRSEITIQKGKTKVNAKSIMGVMMLAAGPGSKVTVRAAGPDAAQAIKEIEKMFEHNFGEKE